MSRRIAVWFLLGMTVVLVGAEVSARVLLTTTHVPVLEWQDFSTQYKASQMDERAEVDVVVVGTSMAQQALVPEVLAAELPGTTAYNAALNGGVPTVMERWLEDQVQPRIGGDTIVWALSSLDLSASYGAATEEAYADAKQTRSGTLAETDRWFSSWSDLVRGRTLMRDPSSLFGDEAEATKADAAQAELEVGPDGERMAFDVDLTEARRRETAARITPFLVDREDLAAIARVALGARDAGTRLVLVELPLPDRFKALYPRGAEQHAIVAETLDALGAELDVLVFHPSAEYADDDFVDFTHLDAEAARRFSTEVADWLAGLPS